MSLLPQDNLVANMCHVDVALVIMRAAGVWARRIEIKELKGPVCSCKSSNEDSYTSKSVCKENQLQ